MVKKARRIIMIPASINEANISLFRLGVLDRSTANIENVLAAEVAQLRRAADARIAPLSSERSDLAAGLQLFAESNRATLLEGDKKSVQLTAGIFGWRFTPPKVEFLRGSAKKALALLKELKLKKYIRIKETVNKEALLEDRPDVPGIKYAQYEEFYFETAPDIGTPETTVNVIALVKVA